MCICIRICIGININIENKLTCDANQSMLTLFSRKCMGFWVYVADLYGLHFAPILQSSEQHVRASNSNWKWLVCVFIYKQINSMRRYAWKPFITEHFEICVRSGKQLMTHFASQLSVCLSHTHRHTRMHAFQNHSTIFCTSDTYTSHEMGFDEELLCEEEEKWKRNGQKIKKGKQNWTRKKEKTESVSERQFPCYPHLSELTYDI